MIRLHRQIERALANRWLRILLLVLLIGLFLLFVAHTTHDAIADGEAFVCFALVVLLFIVVPPHLVVRPVTTGQIERKRGPPRLVVGAFAFSAFPLSAVPLRR